MCVFLHGHILRDRVSKPYNRPINSKQGLRFSNVIGCCLVINIGHIQFEESNVFDEFHFLAVSFIVIEYEFHNFFHRGSLSFGYIPGIRSIKSLFSRLSVTISIIL